MAKLGGSKQKKMNSRVDFTPMVDMIMLLVTFFMLCTTLLKPQTMQISMPSDKEDMKEENRSQIAASKAVTILIDGDNKLYYFKGKPDGGTDLPDEGKLYATTYGKEGLRKVLLGLNPKAVQEVEKLDAEFATKKTSNVQAEQKIKAEYKERLNKIKNADYTPSVIIKASDKAVYDNLLAVLDEMQICSIGRYVIDKWAGGDQAKIDQFNGKAPQAQ